MASTGDLTILVPVDVSQAEFPSLEILDRLRPIEVILLGYFPVPDQAEPALLEDEYGSEAAARLEVVADGRENLLCVLVFTHDREATIDRVADQHGCDAVLTPGETAAIERVLVPLRGEVNLDRILTVVADLLRATGASATLFHAVDGDADSNRAESLLRGASDGLGDRGIDRDRIDYRLSEGVDPHAEIMALEREYDIVVLGETEPSLRERIIGDFLSRVIDETAVPALVVRDIG